MALGKLWGQRRGIEGENTSLNGHFRREEQAPLSPYPREDVLERLVFLSRTDSPFPCGGVVEYDGSRVRQG